MRVVPMIFNADMVKALMAGDKVVTRRPVKVDYERGMSCPVVRGKNGEVSALSFAPTASLCPFGNVGDLIYVRETWGVINHEFDVHGNMTKWTPDRPSTQVKELKFGKGYYTGHAIYRADGEMRWCNDFEEEISVWHPSIHMPRSISRLTLKVTDLRIEKVQNIAEEQCWKEGVEHIDGQFDIHQLSEMAKTFGGTFEDAKSSFACLWDSIYQNWKENPYVWVIEFEVIHQNVDKYLESIEDAA